MDKQRIDLIEEALKDPAKLEILKRTLAKNRVMRWKLKRSGDLAKLEQLIKEKEEELNT